MNKAKIHNLIKQSWVWEDVQNELIVLLNDDNIDGSKYSKLQNMLLDESKNTWWYINTLKQIVSYSLSCVFTDDTKVLDNLKDNFLIALQDYPINLIEKALNVLDSYYSDTRKDKSLRKWVDTKAISRIRNLCTIFGSFDIYDILNNRVEFIDYHLVNSRSDSISQESRLDWAKVKNYFVIKDKVTWNIIIVWDSIQLLYKDFNIPIPNDSIFLKNNRIDIVKKTKFKNLNSKLKILVDEWKYDKNKDLATKTLLSHWINNDMLLSRWLLQKLDEITIKIDKWEYWEVIKSFNPKRNYINWLIENKSRKELPKYIEELINKLVSLNDELSSQDMLILFSYYARESIISMDSIPNIVNNIKYFIDKWSELPQHVINLLNNKEINQIQLLQILDNAWNLLSQARIQNLDTISTFEQTNSIKIKEIIKSFFPLVLQQRKEYSIDMLYFNYILSTCTDKLNLSIIKNLVKVWTVWITNTDDFDFGNKLKNNIAWIESIIKLEGFLRIFLLEYRKYCYCLSLNKPLEHPIYSFIESDFSKFDDKTTWAQLNSTFKNKLKIKFSVKKFPSKLILLQDLKDENWQNINYFNFVDKVSKTYFTDYNNNGSYINWVLLSLSNFTKYGLFPLEKLSDFLSAFNSYNRQWFEPKLESNKELYEDFEFYLWLKSFVSTMYYPKSILNKEYINPSVNEKIQKIVTICHDYFGWIWKESILELYNQFLYISKINQSKNIIHYPNSNNPLSIYFMLTENVFSIDYKNIGWVRFVNLDSLHKRHNQILTDYISFESVKSQYPSILENLNIICSVGFVENLKFNIDIKTLAAFRDLLLRPHNNTVLVPISFINTIKEIITLYKK